MQELIHKIIEIENSAQEITKDARAEKENLPKLLHVEINDMKLSLEQRAKCRLEKIEVLEKELCEKSLAEIRGKLQEALSAIDNKKNVHQKVWEDSLFDSLTQ